MTSSEAGTKRDENELRRMLGRPSKQYEEMALLGAQVALHWADNGKPPTFEEWSRAHSELMAYMESLESERGRGEELAPKEWHQFAEEAFKKALKHLEKYPEDLLDAWNDPRFTFSFWMDRTHQEVKELDEEDSYLAMKNPASHPNKTDSEFLQDIMKEALDKGNMALFIYFYAKKRLAALTAEGRTGEGEKK